MTREQKYAERLQALGIYDEAFEPEIHTLAIMERDHQRTMKRWRDEGSDVTSEIYQVLERQRRDILAHRDALGLTPKAMRRFRAIGAEAPDTEEKPASVLSILRSKYA